MLVVIYSAVNVCDAGNLNNNTQNNKLKGGTKAKTMWVCQYAIIS